MLILDGWGISTRSERNPVFQAFTPNYDDLRARYPYTELLASGKSIGLPDGAPGNSEIGHMNIGAGRVVKSDATQISESIRNGSFFENEVLLAGMNKAAAGDGDLHLIGMLSDGDVHASPETLYALLRMAKRTGVKEVYVHGILDGRDVPPRTADIYVEALEIKMADIGLGKIATLCGRFFAMDSSEHWERTARAFTMLALADGERSLDPRTAIRNSFLRGIADEFIAPIVIEEFPDVPVAMVKNGDTVIFFNHRGDTMKQLVRSLAVPEAGSARGPAKPKIDAICMTDYEPNYGLMAAFAPALNESSVASVLNDLKVPNFRITDADRLPHITSFFNCGSDVAGAYEQHIVLPAANPSTRETEPEMNSFKVTDELLQALDSNSGGVFVVNLPAPDLVAETGNHERTIEAVQYIDTCLGGIVDKIREVNGIGLITSSHANNSAADSGVAASAVSSRVPFHLIDDATGSVALRSGGSLQDVGPTLLALAGIETPPEMTGRDLRLA